MSGVGIFVELALPGRVVVRMSRGGSGFAGRGVFVGRRGVADRGASVGGGSCPALSAGYDGAPARARHEGCGRAVRDSSVGVPSAAVPSWVVREP